MPLFKVRLPEAPELGSMQKETVHVTTKKFGMLRESLGTGCRGGGRLEAEAAMLIDKHGGLNYQAQGRQLLPLGTQGW